MTVPAVASGTLSLRELFAAGAAADGVYGLNTHPAGETISLDPQAVIAGHSRCVEAGARLILAAPRDKAIPINGEKLDGLAGFYTDTSLVRTIVPAQFATVADGSDATESAFPLNDATFSWPTIPSAAFRTRITRAQNRAVGGGEDLRTALLDAILRGLGEYADRVLLAAIAATTPAAFSFGLASAKHLKLENLRGMIGTNGAGAAFRGDGAFVVNPGIPAELTSQTAGSYIGAWGTSAIAVWDELSLHIKRLNTVGDLELIAFTNAQAVVPDAGMFWSAS
ncbi:hypothetical protein C2U34_03455 [Ralstonia solanacearum]|nr:hypothetical protein CIG66_09360 [Ralstonia pseudosolanacearum]TYZ42971.1 hypothetical protein C2U33_11195 [Ralstonia solanacearum]TYZ49555.1 hypothetical protein C2U34_03455 [Ralstonia solanacearum]TYZ51834.1 hypothetical protein C2U35_05865 [Ralstonia solanacearum]